ncbi:MAG: cytidyltransferase-related domain protein [Oscillospiraceae bacterium]|nr:cytidyltransferase-related domain protein [Oscillospiraceae bacterium]
MHDKLIRQVTSLVAERLASRRLPFAPSKKSAQTLLHTPSWTQGLEELLPIRSRLTCARVLELCGDILPRISPEPEDGWLSFCHRYARSLMFPDADFAPDSAAYAEGAHLLLTAMQVLFEQERQALPFDCAYDFLFLSEDEARTCDHGKEYLRFLAALRQEYVYELMRLGNEVTPFRTLNHIAGVHHIAVCAADGLRRAGVSVDPALVSAAAAAHDLGKYGCRPGERVPYLHYYYTDQWLLERNMEGISHIASNHSTWDLELESLSVESLCLIYADFRSKQERDAQGNEISVIYPLEQSFRIILNKLDNVDDAKRRRYEFVYGKLHDFEDYMRRLGVDVELSGSCPAPVPVKDASLMTPDEMIQSITLMAVEHNLELMHALSSERQFGNIIEAARSAKDWKQLRAYLNVFEEYFTYLSARQKQQALAFLYELLVHREGDIRRQAAALIGLIIARFHLVYRKELPANAQADPAEQVPFTLWEQYLDKLIFPDHKTTLPQRSHIGYTLKLVVGSLLDNCRAEDFDRFVGALLKYYVHPERMEADTAFTLLDAIRYLPPDYYNAHTLDELIEFAAHFSHSGESRLQVAALRFLLTLSTYLPDELPPSRRIADIARSVEMGSDLTLVFLQYKLLQTSGEDTALHEALLYKQDIVSDVFLNNLKTATPWLIKTIGIELLVDQVEHGRHDHILHIATHLSNLVKVSERVVVRHDAGRALAHLMPLLRREQRNEVIVELGKGLEMGQYEISKYIPDYLGEAALYLHPTELDEQIVTLKKLLGNPIDSVVSVALSTVGVLLQHYPAYRQRFPESDEVYEARRQELLGMLLQGLAHYREGVRQEAMLVVGKHLFESPLLPLEEKTRLFSLIYQKLLFLLQRTPQDDRLTFFYRASALSHIYRFLSLYRLDHGPMSFCAPRRIAFFPGTFDPFTLSHKGIVQAIRDMGFEVYLAVDEFSWSKKAQPHLIRRQIVSMSVAGDFHVHLFPDNIPVNIANPDDLHRLCSIFPGRQVYMVVGSDVVLNASSYKAQPSDWSIHSMNHIIFRRPGDVQPDLSPITGDVIQLQLPPHLEDISSTRIRENVDLNRDISNFIDPVIQDFIYQNGLYLRDAQNKPVLGAGAAHFLWADRPNRDLLDEVTAARPDRESLRHAMERDGDSLLVLRDTGHKNRLAGWVSYRTLSSAQLFSALKNAELAQRIRLNAAGTVLLITAVQVEDDRHIQDPAQLLLSELLARCVEEDCVYALFLPHSGLCPGDTHDLLLRQGFQTVADAPCLYQVDMRAPTVLIQNLETTIQEPLSHNRRVLKTIRRCHHRLQQSVTGLYPGNLVLTLSSDVIHHRLLEKITAINNVPITPTTPRQLGEYMCVPFGKLLRSKAVPNTVTKTLHTDKVYEPDLNSSSIEAFLHYSPIPNQVRTIKSFNRPVILVDDLMHPGIRINALDPIFRQEDVPIKTVLVGVLSGYGRDLMQVRRRPVDSVYFVPRLRQWFVESTLYPFIGGNTVRRPAAPVPGLLPGINHILPYASPTFRGECPEQAVFGLSRCCLENARDLMLVLETEYRLLYSRNLTLSRLPEAVILPLCPDKGACVSYDPNLAASVYLENDLELLMRTFPDVR